MSDGRAADRPLSPREREREREGAEVWASLGPV